MGERLVGQRVGGTDAVAGQQADPLGTRLDVFLGDQLAVLPGVALHPERRAGQVLGEVKNMSAQHPQILASTAPILLAVHLVLEHAPDFAIAQ